MTVAKASVQKRPGARAKRGRSRRAKKTSASAKDVVFALAVLSILVPVFILGVSSASGSYIQQYPLPALGKANVKIMVLGYSGSFVSNDMILKIMPPDAECDLFQLEQVKNLNLTNYDIVFVLSHAIDFEKDPSNLSISKITNYVNQGGFLVSLLQFNYDWLNLSLGFERRLVTSLVAGNTSDPFYQEIPWSLNGNPLAESDVYLKIGNLTASTIDEGGFFYPAYGVFSSYSGSALLLDQASGEPVLIRSRVGLGTVFVTTCAWDYHLSRTDIPRQTGSAENMILYHVMLYGVMNKPPRGITTLLLVGAAVAVVAVLAAIVMLRRRRASAFRVSETSGRRTSYEWPILLAVLVIAIVAAVGPLLLELLHSDVERLYTLVYQIDKDLDGFPDQGTSITELDDVFLSLEWGRNAVFWYTGVLWITVIALVFGAIVTLLLSMESRPSARAFDWPPIWKRLMLLAGASLSVLVIALIVVGSSLG